MDLLGDLDQLGSRFSSFGYNVSVDARLVLGFALDVPLVQKSF